MSLALYLMGCVYSFVGFAVLFEDGVEVVGALFCLTGMIAFCSGLLVDAISEERRYNEEKRRKRREENE